MWHAPLWSVANCLCSGLVSRPGLVLRPCTTQEFISVAWESERPILTLLFRRPWHGLRHLHSTCFQTVDISLLEASPTLEVHHAVVYSRFGHGDMNCTEIMQYLLETLLLETTGHYLHFFGKCRCLLSVQEEGQYMSLKQVEFPIQPDVNIPFLLGCLGKSQAVAIIRHIACTVGTQTHACQLNII